MVEAPGDGHVTIGVLGPGSFGLFSLLAPFLRSWCGPGAGVTVSDGPLSCFFPFVALLFFLLVRLSTHGACREGGLATDHGM